MFASTRDEFREEDEDEERDREAADLFALQRSRRVAAASKLADSVGSENEGSLASFPESTPVFGETGFPRGIKSSWNGGREQISSKGLQPKGDDTNIPRIRTEDVPEGEAGRGKLVDVGLESEILGGSDPSASLMDGFPPEDTNPPAFQHFNPRSDKRHSLRRESTIDTDLASTHCQAEPNPQGVSEPPKNEVELFKYDSFFAWLFLIMMASLISTFLLVWLHTDAPDGRHPIGDTIYSTLRGSLHTLAVDTLVAIVTALLWLAALRSFVRPMVILIIIAVPVIMLSFSLYPFISSFQGRTHGGSFQDSVMRWASAVPFVGAVVWGYCVIKARHSLRQAIEILEFSSKVLAANPALVAVGIGILVAVVGWTWLWIVMFSRVFLGGHFSTSLAKYVISVSSWWLGVWFVLMYMWTASIITEVHRATTAATVSQWYFHRNTQPAPTSMQIVSAALSHAANTIFGTICRSTLLSRIVRLPLLVLPSRISYLVQRAVNAFVPTPVVAMTNPLTISYAAIHSNDLATSARALSQMDFLAPQTPTTTLTPRVFQKRQDNTASLLPYRLAKLILYASRFILATGMGFAAWVITAKKLEITLPEGAGMRGSAYAYIVGLVASFIGYTVMGSMESILSGIVDAVVICYGSERRMASGGGGYCMEAAYLFGERRRRPNAADYA